MVFLAQLQVYSTNCYEIKIIPYLYVGLIYLIWRKARHFRNGGSFIFHLLLTFVSSFPSDFISGMKFATFWKTSHYSFVNYLYIWQPLNCYHVNTFLSLSLSLDNPISYFCYIPLLYLFATNVVHTCNPWHFTQCVHFVPGYV